MATPYKMDWLFFEELFPDALLEDELLDEPPETVLLEDALLEAVLAGEPDLLLVADVWLFPVFVFVSPLFSLYFGTLTVFFFVFLTFCAVTETSREYPSSADFLIVMLVIPIFV